MNTPARQDLVRGFVLYVGYLTLFFATWVANGVDYRRIGESLESTRVRGDLLL